MIILKQDLKYQGIFRNMKPYIPIQNQKMNWEDKLILNRQSNQPKEIKVWQSDKYSYILFIQAFFQMKKIISKDR